MIDPAAIDHLVLAGPDLAMIVSMWRETTGIDPTPGDGLPCESPVSR